MQLGFRPSLVLVLFLAGMVFITNTGYPNAWQDSATLWFLGLTPIVLAIGIFFGKVDITRPPDVFDLLLFGRLLYSIFHPTAELHLFSPESVLALLLIWAVAIRRWDFTQNDLTLVTKSLLYVSIIQAGLALTQVFFWNGPLLPEMKNAVTGSTGSPNSTGWLIVPGLVVILQNSKEGFAKSWVKGAIVLMVTGLIVCESRSAWLMVIGATLVLKWAWLRRFVSFKIVVVAIFLTITFFVSLNADSSFGRVYIYRVVWAAWADHYWLGLGLGGIGRTFLEAQTTVLSQPFWSAYAGKATHVFQAHNVFLNVLVEQGIIGLSLFLAIIIPGFVTLNKNQALRPWIFVILPPMLVDAPFHVLPIAWLMYLFLGYHLPGNPFRQCTPGLRFVTSFAVVLLAWFVFLPAISARHHALKTWQLGRAAIIRMDWRVASNFLDAIPVNTILPAEYNMNRAAVLLHTGRPKEAAVLLADLLPEWSTRSSLLLLGQAYLASGEFAASEKTLIRLSNMFPAQLAPKRYLLELYLTTQDWKKASVIVNQIASSSKIKHSLIQPELDSLITKYKQKTTEIGADNGKSTAFFP